MPEKLNGTILVNGEWVSIYTNYLYDRTGFPGNRLPITTKEEIDTRIVLLKILSECLPINENKIKYKIHYGRNNRRYSKDE